MTVAAAALPYIRIPLHIGALQPYGIMVLAALVLGGVAMALAARRLELPQGEIIALAGVLVITGIVGAHVLDVIAYQLDDAGHDGSLWLHVERGVSLFGALAAAFVTTFLWGSARKLDLAKLFDCVALGVVVALVFGRLACALVHDHPGMPTSSPLGVDFPREMVAWLDLDTGTSPTIRLHDLGLDELLAVIPLAIAMWSLLGRLRPGRLAVVFALAYAPIRFGLDFLRLPVTEPHHAGLTAGQWGCIVLALAGIAELLAGGVAGPAGRPAD